MKMNDEEPRSYMDRTAYYRKFYANRLLTRTEDIERCIQSTQCRLYNCPRCSTKRANANIAKSTPLPGPVYFGEASALPVAITISEEAVEVRLMCPHHDAFIHWKSFTEVQAEFVLPKPRRGRVYHMMSKGMAEPPIVYIKVCMDDSANSLAATVTLTRKDKYDRLPNVLSYFPGQIIATFELYAWREMGSD